MTALFCINREVRVIPQGWQPPAGRPLLPRAVYAAYSPTERAVCGYTEADLMPDVAGLAPDDTEIVAYETVTEGSPISPAFPNTPAGRLSLVQWCAGNARIFGGPAGAEVWAGGLFGGRGVYFQPGAGFVAPASA